MKIAIFAILAAIVVAVCALPFRDYPTLPRHIPGNWGPPTFPGQGPFNPKLPPGSWRYRRSPDGGRVTVDQPIDGKASIAVDMEQKVYENKHGSVVIYGGGKATQDHNPEGQAGIRGEFRWGGEASNSNYAARLDEIDRLRKEAKID